MNHIILQHAKLGSLKCLQDTSAALVKVLGLPYGTVSQRFARSQICSDPSSHPSSHTRYRNNTFDATIPGPSSIQPYGSVKSDASNIPLPTENLPDDEEQSEDCLNLSIHLPPSAIDASSKNLKQDVKLPVVVFIHGGAYFLGSANRPYYSPVSFLSHAISQNNPIIVVSINYRLGALGFWHTQTSSDLVPPNNGLHDQLLALEWVQQNISGFGGDPSNVTALGQSAGGESLSVLSNSSIVKEKKLFRRAIMFSGTPVTMPSMTPAEHDENFKKQAERLGVETNNKDAESIAQEAIGVDIGKIRDLAWVGSPCTQTSLFPFDKPTMGMMRQGGPEAWGSESPVIEAQIVSSTTYDGGISYNMMARDEARSKHASAFVKISDDVLGPSHGAELCSIYGVEEDQDDADALQRICLFESDIGFFFGALSIVEAGLLGKTYLQVFDLANPFDGPIRERGEFATHTFDITTLLGGYDQEKLPEGYAAVIASWRDKILEFVRDGTAPCEAYGEKGRALMVNDKGAREVERAEYMDSDEGRRRRLMELAEKVDGKEGWDVLWVNVCRRFLMKGE